jgi:hypothetical protein
VYRNELRPVITRGARVINELLDGDTNLLITGVSAYTAPQI